jgi:hypothetical protein
LYGEHSNVAAESAAAVGLELADDDANEGVGLVEGLGESE